MIKETKRKFIRVKREGGEGEALIRVVYIVTIKKYALGKLVKRYKLVDGELDKS